MSEKNGKIEVIKIENGDSQNLAEEIPSEFKIGKFDTIGYDSGVSHTGTSCIAKWGEKLIKTIKLWTNRDCGLFGVTRRVTLSWFLLYGISVVIRYVVNEHFTPECRKTSDSKSYKLMRQYTTS